MRADLQLQSIQAAKHALEHQQAAADLQESWHTVHQQNERYRSRFQELQDGPSSASQDMSRFMQCKT